MRRWIIHASLLMSSAAAPLVLARQAPAAATYAWDLPAGWPLPEVPGDNPISDSKVALGRLLFYDTRLSANGTQSCATCHEQVHAFADAKAQVVGSTGERHTRGSMSLVNVAYASTLTWGNPPLTRLEGQALVPMFGHDPIELGLNAGDSSWLERLRRVPEYGRGFAAAFGVSPDPFTITNVTRALASFERSIISARSPYDAGDYERDESAASLAVRRGEALFFSQTLSCVRCHSGFTFSAPVEFAGRVTGGEAPLFQNTGLYNLAATLSYPAGGRGLYETTDKPADVGKFKAPTLRNIAVTAPYMHDGSLATLDEVLDHYMAGGRTIADGPWRGIGRDNPNKSRILRGFPLAAEERRDLLAFLRALTDDALLNDARFSNPWRANAP